MLRASRALRRDERARRAAAVAVPAHAQHARLDELARVRTDVGRPRRGGGLGRAARAGVQRARGRARAPRAASATCSATSATLPAQQRHALLRREVDGISHAALAAELGVSPQATKNLVHRARTNLVKQRAARSARLRRRCARDLLGAHDAGRRASGRDLPPPGVVLRHCRAFRGGLRDTRKAAAILMPGPLMVGRPRAARPARAPPRRGKGAMAKTGRHRRGGRGDDGGRGRHRRRGLRRTATPPRRRPTSRALPGPARWPRTARCRRAPRSSAGRSSLPAGGRRER